MLGRNRDGEIRLKPELYFYFHGGCHDGIAIGVVP
jgi:hypothetical protein